MVAVGVEIEAGGTACRQTSKVRYLPNCPCLVERFLVDDNIGRVE